MELLLERKWKKEGYTIGNLYVNEVFFSNTLEDKDRGLNSSMPLEEIKRIKKKSITAIPTGTYHVLMNIVSPKYSTKEWFVKNCNQGRMPRLKNVLGFDGILIHTGNTAADTDGCILIGKNNIKGKVSNSKEYFLKLYNIMYAAFKKNENITITIK